MPHPAFRDVLAYPPALLRRSGGAVLVAVSYRREWRDGFGARGWKLDATLDDPEIIASTRVAGERIPTSVFVHDLLDHLLSGFAPSGHRAEAMALARLARRTGADVAGDYAQMVREDLFAGRVLGEAAADLLGAGLVGLTPPGCAEPIAALRACLGDGEAERWLVERFFQLGAQGHDHAEAAWRSLGLDPAAAAELGLAVQAALDAADREAEETGLERAEGIARVGEGGCSREIRPGASPDAPER
jgi:hypothetical protein